MYTANKKTETFRPAFWQGKFTLTEKLANTLYRSQRNDNAHRLKLIIFCLIFAINAALPKTGLAATYYVDPSTGNTNNDGSSDSPWRTVQEVFDNGLMRTVVQPGDTVYLRDGYHGEINYSNHHNSDYITVAAQSGHTPELMSISIRDVSKWIFRGFKISPELDPGPYSSPQSIIRITGTSEHIIIENNTIYSIWDSSGWTINDWNTFVADGVNADGPNYITVRNNTMKNVAFGVLATGDHSLIEYNTIENFTADGIRAGGWDCVYQYNVVKNCYDIDSNHDDGIQVYTGSAYRPAYRMIIRGNMFINHENANQPFLGSMQPIGCFQSGVNIGWTVENNITLTNRVNGIVVRDATDSVIVNNIVFNPYSETNDGNPGISLREAPVNTVVRNNMAHFFPGSSSEVTSTNNLDIDNYNFDELFVQWRDIANFDLRHAAGSPAIDAGTPEDAPSIDILGNSRPLGNGYDIGAYEDLSGPPDDTPPSIPQNLVAQAISESQIDLSWDTSSDPESGIRYYRIYRDGSEIDTSTSTSYSDTGLTSNTTYVYRVSAVNGAGLESGLSNTAQATTLSDITAPTILSVGASETSVVITFSEPLDSTSAEQTSNYSINNGISVTAASLDTDTVTLTTSAHTEGTYTLTVVNVQDTSDNPITETTTDYEYNEGLTGHWKFDASSGSSAVDSSGNNNTGTLINGPTWTTGKFNGGLSFDGVDDAVEIGTAGLNSGAGTIALWNYAASFAPTEQYLFGHASQPWANRIQLYTDDPDGYLDLGLGSSHSTHTRIHNLDTQRWYHIALTWDGSNYTVYVDSSAQATGTYSDLSTLETYADIGNDGSRSDRTGAFNGLIDEVRIYNRALSASEVSDLVNAPPNTYTLSITAVGGSVTRTPNQASYDSGTTVTLQAVANTGYNFVSWSGDASGSSNPTTVVMDGNKSITANFAVDTYTLDITATNGSVTKTPDQASYGNGTTVTLQATANAGYTFASWSGDASGTSNPTTVVMDGNKSVTANFTINTYTLDITATNGSVAKTPDQTSYNHGTTVTLQAVANTGYNFVSWSGDASGSSNPITVVMDDNKSITANFAVDTYTLGITATNGSVTKTPDQASYGNGTTVTLQATANAGYNFASWSGDASGTSNPTTVVMDDNKSVTANFTINTYTLGITATNGSVAKTPDQASYDSGTTVTLQATANTGYTFASWSGDASGTSNPTTVVMDGNKSVTANFTINTYTLDITATNGSVTKTPDQSSYDHGTTVTLQATANTDYTFASWSGDASGTSNPTTVVMDGNKSITANFTVGPDETAPTVTQQSPAADSVQVSLNSLISLHVVDAGDGVDSDSVIITVNGDTVYTGNTADYISNYGRCHRTGTEADYRFVYQSDQVFDFDQTINVTVNALDLAGNPLTGYSYSFKTEMHSFGENKKVSSDTLSKGRPVTVRDNSGNIWAALHAGATGSRDIYIGKLAAGADNFGNSIIIRDNSADQCNPVIAAGSDDKLYVAWQDNRRGNWDIYISTSNDGVNWSADTRITDSNDNQINPAIVVDSSNNAYIVWEDDRNGNQDIYIAESSNGFVTKTISQITSNSSDQVDPAIAADSDNTVYIVWTDTRNSKNDIYGAASNNGPWTNVAIVNNTNNQSNPAVATETVGSFLHLVWVDNTPGNDDIFYAKTSGGLPGSPLTGSSIIDDTTGADQSQPVIAVASNTGNNLKVFVCWQDERWLSSSGDTDLFFDEITSSSGTDVFVGDDSTNSEQTEPAIGIDGDGNPYLIWTDSRNTNTDIYYAGSTSVESTVLASSNTSTSSTVTVGTPLNAIDSVDDVSVVVPAGAYPFDIEITISKISNPLAFAMQRLVAYDFGPSGIEFSQPVTVTIPYNATESATVAYWYNSLTDALSQQGITDVETIVVSPTLHALSFKTTHFTPFYIFLVSAGGAAASGGGGGGGGCSMSPDSQASAVELLLPYIGLTVTMVVLKLKDKRKRKARNITKSKC